MPAEAWMADISRDTYVKHLKQQKAITRQLAAILRDAAQEAQRMITVLEKYDGLPYQIRAAQYRQSLRALQELQAEIWRDVGNTTLDSLEKAIELGAEGTQRIDDFLSRAMQRSREPFPGFNAQRIADLAAGFDTAADRAIFNVISRIKNDIDLSDLVYRNQALAEGKVARAINRGLALNRSAKEIADSVKRFINPNVPGGQSYAAMRLGRTEINNAFHRTTIETAGEQPWIEGFQWNLSGSHKKPDRCNEYADLDHDNMGKGVFSKKNVPAKPHPQCLCYLTTVSVGVDEFISQLLAGKYQRWVGKWS